MSVLTTLAFTVIAGKPILIWSGIITYIFFIFTAMIPILVRRGIRIIPFTWHHRIAMTSLILATIHGMLALSAF